MISGFYVVIIGVSCFVAGFIYHKFIMYVDKRLKEMVRIENEKMNRGIK